jgi:hypothetical protein
MAPLIRCHDEPPAHVVQIKYAAGKQEHSVKACSKAGRGRIGAVDEAPEGWPEHGMVDAGAESTRDTMDGPVNGLGNWSMASEIGSCMKILVAAIKL